MTPSRRSVDTMHPLNSDPTVRALVSLALGEDRVDSDVTSHALVPGDAKARGSVVARAAGVIAGLVLLDEGSPLRERFPHIAIDTAATDGAPVAIGDVVVTLSGPARDLLGLERTLLNFIQRMSGIATTTAEYVEAARGTRARIQETRKTCPGWRALDKYAVTCGGGLNHRMSLADMVLVKENHLAFAGHARSPDGVREGIRRARAAGDAVPIEIEVENLDQFDAALAEAPDIVMLDEFSDDMVAEAVRRRDTNGPPPPLIEVSGSVTLERIKALSRLGVDRISVGALTHSAHALDLALDVEPLP